MKKRNIALLGLGAIGAGYGALIKYYYDYCFKRVPAHTLEGDSPYVQRYQEGMKFVDSVAFDQVSIESFDHLKLNGYYVDQKSEKTIILVHGYHSNAFEEYATFIEFLYKDHFNILVIDQRSHGKSEGKWIDFGYNESKDLVNWSAFIQNNYPCQSLYYLGISMGSATVLTTSGCDLSPYHVKGIIADCGYDTLENELKHVIHKKKLPVFVFFGPSNLIHKLHTGHSIKESNPIDGVRKTKVPILFIHGTEDHFVPTHYCYSLYKACPSEKELYLVKDAKHACSHVVEKEEYEQKVLNFLHKHQ